MNCLLIDSAEGVRLLLNIDGKPYYAENLTNAGAETLMPTIDKLCSDAEIKISDIDIFGVCIGPGSFTGLRVGISTIKTFCYSLGKPCFAVNNLRLNSYNNSSAKVISVANAGSNVCYIAMFDGDTVVMETTCVTRDEAKRIIEEHPDYAVSTDVKLGSVFGGTCGVHQSELMTAMEKHVGNRIDQKDLLPLYVRKAQPERAEGDL